MRKFTKRVIEVENQNEKIKNDVVEFIFNGYSFSDIVEYLQITYNITKEQSKVIYKRAKVEIVELGNFDYDTIIMQHVFYYEEAARFFDSINNFSGKARALEAKEKLLKIYEEEEPTIEIENNIDVNVEQLNFDINKLSADKKNRFQELFNKVKFLNANNK